MKDKYIQISHQLAKKLLLELLDRNDFSNDMDIMRRLEKKSFKESNFAHSHSLSRITIDKGCRILLSDYSNREVIMPYLSKTVYLFFLIHPEGIEFKKLHHFHQELYSIYQEVSINRNMEADKIKYCIHNLVNLSSNRIYEICSIIRKSFCKTIAPDLADQYCIVGKRGKVRQIQIDRNLVFVENEKIKQMECRNFNLI